MLLLQKAADCQQKNKKNKKIKIKKTKIILLKFIDIIKKITVI